MRFQTTVELGGGTAAGATAGQQVEVESTVDDAPREVAVPDDLAAVLDATAREFFDTLAPSHRQEWVRWIEDAKKPETRATRVARAAARLAAGEKTH